MSYDTLRVVMMPFGQFEATKAIISSLGAANHHSTLKTSGNFSKDPIMKKIKKILSILSRATHGLYLLLCLAEIAFCALYTAYYPITRSLTGIALYGFGFVTFAPFMPIGFGLNAGLLVTHIVDKKERKASKIVWQSVRTALCPVLCVVLWMITGITFIEATGGA